MSRSHPLDRVLGRLGTTERRGSNWLARCPSGRHCDPSAALRVSIGRRGDVVLFCPSGCQAADVVDALGMRLSDLFVEPRR